MTQRREFRLPDVGEGLTEADIVSWRVKPGDSVQINQIIVDIETAKAIVELPCPFEGVVASLLVAEGETVDVGTPIIAVDVADAAGSPATPSEPSVPATVGPVDPAAIAAAGPRPGPDDLVPPVATGPAPASPAPPRKNGRPCWSATGLKPARRPGGRARHRPGRGVQLKRFLPGQNRSRTAVGGPLRCWPSRWCASWPGTSAWIWPRWPAPGRPARSPGTTCSGPRAARRWPRCRSSAEQEERIPIRGVRKHTAAAVAGSAFTAPHVTEFLQVEVGATMDAVARLRDLPEFAGVRVSPLLMVARALLIAVKRHPMINSTWDEAAQEIVVKHYVNLGIAAATERGLIVPNVKDAGTLSLPALAGALADLVATARAGKSSPADLTGGTITITNVGVFGVDAGTPILTPPEAAILAFGQVKDAPWVVDGQLAVRPVTTLSLSFDHRIVDGDLGSAVLRDVADMLHDPARMLAWG